jgi:rubredoxin
MAKWECLVCGWIYDEEVEGIKFEDQPHTKHSHFAI